MVKSKHSDYSASVADRILLIMQLSGLTIKGLEEFTNISGTHIYALMNGNKRINGKMAEKLSTPFNLKGIQLLNLDYELGDNVKKTPNLVRFKKEYKDNYEYFTDAKNNTKLSYFIEYEFLNNSIFSTPAYLWEISDILTKQGKRCKNKDLSQILHYLVIKKRLLSEKRPIKLKSGNYGKRIVEVFFRKIE